MHLFLTGFNHETAGLELRERIHLEGERMRAIRHELHTLSEVHEIVVLSTCNRLEFYLVMPQATAIGSVSPAIASLLGLDPSEAAECSYQMHGERVVQHLADVATGLNSQILGETEIFGQVKEAYQAACHGGEAGPVFHRVFQKVFHAVKVARSRTAIGEGQVSIATVAVDLAEKIFGRLQEVTILVLGAGDIGEKTIKALHGRGARRITVASRSLGRAMAAARPYGGSALEYDRIRESLGFFDILITSTSAPGYILEADTIQQNLLKRTHRPLFLVDLALPRDIDPAAGNLTNVFLYNLEDLSKIADDNLLSRKAAVTACREILAKRCQRVYDSVSQRSNSVQSFSSRVPCG